MGAYMGVPVYMGALVSVRGYVGEAYVGTCGVCVHNTHTAVNTQDILRTL